MEAVMCTKVPKTIADKVWEYRTSRDLGTYEQHVTEAKVIS